MDKSTPSIINTNKAVQTIGHITLDSYLDKTRKFHGHLAPGMMIGGFMVDMALKHLPDDILFDAICETPACLPDAIQILTPCTIGNGWMTVEDFGRYALVLFEKYSGAGIRVWMDDKKLKSYPHVYSWFMKQKPKKDQDSHALKNQILEAGDEILSFKPVVVDSRYLKKSSFGPTGICQLCHEAYPKKHGRICRSCHKAKVVEGDATLDIRLPNSITSVPIAQSIGKTAVHDMTSIIPGISKTVAVKKGQVIGASDLCRLQKMGRNHIYIENESFSDDSQIHENDAAKSFARLMAGDQIQPASDPKEGKIDFSASTGGLFVVDKERLEQFNRVEGVMCATRKSYSIVKKGISVAGTRSIPLFLKKQLFDQAVSVLEQGPLFHVHPIVPRPVGILVTGTEIFKGLVKDRFIPIITRKVLAYGCTIQDTVIAPDDERLIEQGIKRLIDSGAQIIVTTAGLSVDPDDVTRNALINAGATDMIYGMPILPGAMTLLAKIGSIRLIGVPACALYYQTTSFDLILPRILADLELDRDNISALGHGAFCWQCKTCAYPKCNFGKD